MSDINETKSDIFERAIFGTWDDKGLVRQKGLLEQATDNAKHFEHLGKLVHKLAIGQTRLQRLLIIVAVVPLLKAIGLNTDQIAPFILRAIETVFKAI